MSNLAAQPNEASALDIFGGRTNTTPEGCPPMEGKGAAPPQAQPKAGKTKGKAAGGKGAKGGKAAGAKGTTKGAALPKAGT